MVHILCIIISSILIYRTFQYERFTVCSAGHSLPCLPAAYAISGRQITNGRAETAVRCGQKTFMQQSCVRQIMRSYTVKTELSDLHSYEWSHIRMINGLE